MDAKEEAVKRSRTTLYLLLAGGAVLLVPLMVLLYLRSNEAGAGDADKGARTFARRENMADRIKAAPTPAPPMQATSALLGGAGMPPTAAAGQGTDSLGFIKGGSDFQPAEKASTETAKAEPAPKPAPPPEVAKAETAAKDKSKTKAGAKPFMQPRLQGSKFSSNFKSGLGQKAQAGQMPPGGMPGGAGMPDMSSMMQGMMPGGAGAGGAAGAAGGGMPDMSKMMQGMMPGSAGAATPAAAATKKK